MAVKQVSRIIILPLLEQLLTIQYISNVLYVFILSRMEIGMLNDFFNKRIMAYTSSIKASSFQFRLSILNLHQKRTFDRRGGGKGKDEREKLSILLNHRKGRRIGDTKIYEEESSLRSLVKRAGMIRLALILSSTLPLYMAV